jgi:hypothetical protein
VLDREVWAPLIARVQDEERRHPFIARRWGDRDSAGGLCALVLECTARWAVDSKRKAASVPLKAARLLDVEARALNALRAAVGLLEERDELIERDGLKSEPEAINDGLEELIEFAALRYPHWHLVVEEDMRRFLMLSRNTTNVAPRLRDLLEAAIGWPLAGDVTALRASDAEVLKSKPGGSRSSAAARVRQFLASLDNIGVRPMLEADRVGPLQWIGPTAVAHLLSVVADGKPASTEKDTSGAFNAEAVGKARREYLRDK